MREQTEGPTDAQVSRTCGAFTRSGVVCDREPGHVGDHRGYVEEVDEAVFWPQSASMDMIQATLESALAAAQAEGENLKARIYFLEQANSILARQRDEAEADLAAAREEIAQWQTWGIIEIAVRNPNVSSYMEHWESRALKAESEVARLQQEKEALRMFAYHSSRCSINFVPKTACDCGLVALLDPVLVARP